MAKRISRPKRVLLLVTASALFAYAVNQLQSSLRKEATRVPYASDYAGDEDEAATTRRNVLSYFQADPPPEESKHTFGQDGLLVVNANGSHPIFELIKHANQQWRRKIRKSSKTLDEAVVEYKRRYRRAPPRGFDLW